MDRVNWTPSFGDTLTAKVSDTSQDANFIESPDKVNNTELYESTENNLVDYFELSPASVLLPCLHDEREEEVEEDTAHLFVRRVNGRRACALKPRLSVERVSIAMPVEDEPFPKDTSIGPYREEPSSFRRSLQEREHTFSPLMRFLSPWNELTIAPALFTVEQPRKMWNGHPSRLTNEKLVKPTPLRPRPAP